MTQNSIENSYPKIRSRIHKPQFDQEFINRNSVENSLPLTIL